MFVSNRGNIVECQGSQINLQWMCIATYIYGSVTFLGMGWYTSGRDGLMDREIFKGNIIFAGKKVVELEFYTKYFTGRCILDYRVIHNC